jgi:cell wall-associated NlpC family hydrolase
LRGLIKNIFNTVFIRSIFFVALSLQLLNCGGLSPGTSTWAQMPGDQVIQVARGQIGASYSYGGKSPTEGFDCSGLAWWSHSQNNIPIPRTVLEQYTSGRSITRSFLMPGDIIFFQTQESCFTCPNYPTHVGVYAGNNIFVHAPKSGKVVKEENLETNPYWKERYLGARRYW